jgi:hypothetical protein
MFHIIDEAVHALTPTATRGHLKQNPSYGTLPSDCGWLAVLG